MSRLATAPQLGDLHRGLTARPERTNHLEACTTALHALTLHAADQMHLDAELGSIECGEWAEFTVLAQSPLAVDPLAVWDIPAWGTVVGGVATPVSRRMNQHLLVCVPCFYFYRRAIHGGVAR